MADLIVIVPSRGRPEAVGPLAEAFKATCTADTTIVLALDEDDPTYARYVAEAFGDGYSVMFGRRPGPIRSIVAQPNGSMVSALNRAALLLATEHSHAPDCSIITTHHLTCTCGAFSVRFSGIPFAIGFMGDDHCPRSVGWDAAYLEALRDLGTGIVYGNDLIQGEKLPTQVAMTADIVRTLGYMAPPDLTHLYVDDAWLSLGRALDRITYLPDVVVEHVHPVAGKAEWDEGYARVNASSLYARDRVMFERWLQSLPLEVARLKAVAR